MGGLLEPFAEAYRSELRARGYTARWVVPQLRQVARVSRWLQAQGLTAADLDESRVGEFVAVQRAAGRYRSQWSRPGLRCLVEVLREQEAVRASAEPSAATVSARVLASFERYLLSERGLAPGTVGGYLAHADRFLRGLTVPDVSAVTAAQVTAAVVAVSGSGWSVSAAQNFVAGLRAFLQFCVVEGLLDIDLAGAALTVTGRPRSPLPRGISQLQAGSLLACCDRRTALGRRDYAIILVLLRLGLRRGELAALTLEDLDWRAGEVVVCGKGGRRDRLPLPADVGAAIAGYLRHGRPDSPHRELSLRGRAPLQPIDGATVSSTVRRACGRVRDYVHVEDIADAHLLDANALDKGMTGATYIIGRGKGSSVLEVLRVVADVTGRDTTPEVLNRRAGDPARVVASVDEAHVALGFSATRDLPEMVRSAWAAWRAAHDRR